MTLSRSVIIIALLGFSLMAAAPAFAQTKAEIDQVAAITKTEQTKFSALNFIADLALTRGDHKKAQSCYKKILDIIKSDPGVGPKSAQYAMYMSRLALSELKLEQKDDARKMSKDALALIEGQTPDNNPSEGNFILMTRQNCKLVLGKDTPPPGPPKPPPLELKSIPLLSIANLAKREEQVSKYMNEAEKNLKSRNAEIRHKANTAYMKDLLYLANIYTLEKRTAEAEPMFKKVIPLVEKKSGKNSQELITALSNYGYCLVRAGKTNEAGLILNRMQTIRAAQEAKQQNPPHAHSSAAPHGDGKS